MKKRAAESHETGSCEEALRDLLTAAASPDNLDAFLRRIVAALSRKGALDSGLAVVLLPGGGAPCLTAANFTRKEQLRLPALLRNGSKLPENFIKAAIHAGAAKGWLLARLPAPADRACAAQVLELAAKTIQGRLVQECRDGQLTRERDVADAVTSLEELYLASPSITIEEISRTVLDEARRLTGSLSGFAGYISPETGWLNVPSFAGFPPGSARPGRKDLVFREFTGLWGWVLKNKKPLLTNSAGSDPRAEGVPCGHMKIDRFAAAPALAGEQLIGILALAGPAADYTPAALDAVRKLARVYALMLCHKLAEQQQHAADMKHKSILDTSSDLIYNLTVDGKLTYVSRAVEHFGYTAAEVLGRHFSEFIQPADRKRITRAFLGAVKAGQPLPLLSYRLLKKDGSYALVEQKSAILPRPGATPLITGVMRDITAYRLAAEQLEETELKYKTIFDKANAAIILADAATGVILDANKDAEKLTGRARKELIGMNRQLLHPPEAAAHYKKQFRDHARKGFANFAEGEIVRKNGSRAQVQISTSRLTLGGRAVLQGIFQDVTAQRRTEEQFKAATLLNKNIVDNAREGIIVYGRDLRFRLFNPFMEKFTGLKAKDVLGRQPLEVFPFLKETGVADRLKRILRGARTGPLNFHFLVEKTGREGWASDFSYPLRDDSGRITGIVGIIRDITAPVKTEAKYQALVENTDTGYLILNSLGQVVDANKEYLRLTGRRRLREIMGRRVTDWTAWYDKERNQREIGNCLKNGCTRNLSIDYTDPKGNVLPVEINATVLKTGDSYQIVALCRDISRRRQAENLLRESEERYRLLFDNTADPSFIQGPNGRILAVNKAACQAYGYTKAEFAEMAAAEIEVPQEATNIGRRIAQLLKSRNIRFETRHRLKNGAVITVDVAAQATTWDGKPATLSTCRDISATKRAETALRESEDKYRRLVENMGKEYFFYRHDTKGVFNYLSPAITDMLGYSPEEFLTSYVTYLTGNPRNKEVVKHTNLSIRGIQQPPYIVEIYHKDGSIRLLDVTETPMRDAAGKVVGVEGLAHDITEIERASEKLRELNAAIDQAFDGIAIADLNGVMQFANSSWAQMHGYDKDRLTSQNLAIFHTKEQLESQVHPFNRKVLARGAFEGEVGHVRKDGTEFPTWMSTSLWRDSKGVPLGFIGMARDITESKRLSETLKESESKYRALFETSRDALMILEPPHWNFSQANRATLKMFGAAKEADFLKLTPWAISPRKQPDGGASLEKALRMMDTALKTGSNYFEWEHKHLDGTPFAAEVLLTRVTINEKQVIQASVRDISARKRTEAALRQNEETLSRIFETASDAIFLKDTAGTYLKANKACSDLFLVDYEKMPGHTAAELFSPEIAAATEKDDAEVIKTGKTLLFNREQELPSGKIYVSVAKTPLRGADGEIIGILGMGRDITALKKLEKELAVASAADAMSKVARPIAHDFNNALAAISGYASMIDDDIAEESPLKKEIAQILKAVARAAGISSKLQDFARNPKLDGQEGGKE